MHHRRSSPPPVSAVAETTTHAGRSPLGRLVDALVEAESTLVARDSILRTPDMESDRPELAAAELERRVAMGTFLAFEESLDRLDGGLAAVAEPLEMAPGLAGAAFDLVAALHLVDQQGRLAGAPPWGTGGDATWAGTQAVVLRVAGLADELADRHLRAALRRFRSSGWEPDLTDAGFPEAVSIRLRRGRDAAGALAESMGRRGSTRGATLATRRQTRRTVDRLGGLVIVASAVESAGLLGALPAAVSATVGATGCSRRERSTASTAT